MAITKFVNVVFDFMIGNKKDKLFTIIILSNADSKIRKIKIPHILLRYAFIFTAILVAVTITLVSNLYLVKNQLGNKLTEMERIKEKITYKEVEIANLENKSNEITAKTKILEEYLSTL